MNIHDLPPEVKQLLEVKYHGKNQFAVVLPFGKAPEPYRNSEEWGYFWTREEAETWLAERR